VIGDLGGLAAALAMRGIDCVQVPTTLLAQADSAVGGKTAINLPQGKNLVGVFHQPAAVICDLDTLSTLPRRELLAGYAEIVKYGLLGDAEFFFWLEMHGAEVLSLQPEALHKAVATACRKKAEIVTRDEREGQAGMRALLNLGHTFGHALEAAAGYDSARLLHGEAVAIGMVLAFKLSARLGLCSEADSARAEAHLRAIGLPTGIAMISPPLTQSAIEIMAYMQHDKKIVGGKINFILTHGIGKAFITNQVSPDDVKVVIKSSLSKTPLEGA